MKRWVGLGIGVAGGAILVGSWWVITTIRWGDYLWKKLWQEQAGKPLIQAVNGLERNFNLIPEVNPRLRTVKRLLPVLPQILGAGGSKEYLILLQNNMELRPTGGFLGSYARVKLVDGYVADINVNDIYTPDGQLPGYVEPPAPIKKYLNSNGWLLRDSNWEADFRRSAPVIEWFFEQGKEAAVDGMVAINLNFVQEMLAAVGPVYLADYAQTVTAENLFEKAETHSEVNFFPGSTQKKDFLGQLAVQLVEAVKVAGKRKAWRLAEAVERGLAKKDVLVWVKDDQVSRVLRQLDWDGAVVPTSCPEENCLADDLLIVEANLGVNKTNCCLDRRIDQKVELTGEGKLANEVKLNYVNHNPKVPQPPQFWGGGYKNYLRVYVPKGNVVEAVTIDGLPVQLTEVDQEDGPEFKVVGWLINVGGGEQQTVVIRYSRTLPSLPDKYKLQLHKQSGTNADPYSLTFMASGCPPRQTNRQLDQDKEIEITIACK